MTPSRIMQLLMMGDTPGLPFSQDFSTNGDLTKWSGSGAKAVTDGKLTNTPTTTGENLIGDSGFDSAEYWTAAAGWSVADGKAVADAAAAGNSISRASIMTAGKWYRSVFDFVRSANGVRPTFGGSSVGITRNGTANDCTDTAYAGSTVIALSASGGALTGNCDDFTLIQLTLNTLPVVKQFPTPNVTVSATLTLTAGMAGGVVACLDNPAAPTYYLALFHDGVSRCYLIKNVNGTVSQVVAFTKAYSAGATIQLAISGTTARATYNGTSAADQTIDAAFANYRYAGAWLTDVSAQVGRVDVVRSPFDLSAVSQIIAANNSTWYDKAAAQVICDGTADNVEIQAGLTATAAGKTLQLMTGTYTLAEAVTQAAGTLAGSGNGTVFNVGAIAGDDGAAITAAVGGTLRDFRVTGNVAQATGRKVQMANTSTIQNVVIDNNNYGVDCLGCAGVTVNYLTCTNIQATPNKWAAALHSGAGTNGVTATNIVATDCDRGIETENGAQSVSVDGATLTNINNTALDVHTHNGDGGCSTISYKNITLTNYGGFAVGGVDLVDDKADGITLENITATGNTDETYAMVAQYADNVTITNVSVARGACADGTAAVNMHHGDVLTIAGLTIDDDGAGEPYQIAEYTNVTGENTIVVI